MARGDSAAGRSRTKSRWLAVALVAVSATIMACRRSESSMQPPAVCSGSWYRMIEEKVPTGDGQGHGPDVGSDEWRSVVEFKLGMRGEADVPRRDSAAWCLHIDEIVRSDRTSSAGSGNSGRVTREAGP